MDRIGRIGVIFKGHLERIGGTVKAGSDRRGTHRHVGFSGGVMG